jgi:hypothetical protein
VLCPDLQAGVVPDWEQAAQAGRRLQGSGPTNKAPVPCSDSQIERIEEQLKAGVVPDWEQAAQAGRKA